MKLYSEQLSTHLKQELAPIYILSGDEILLSNEARLDILTAAKAKAYTERQIIDVTANLNWDQLINHSQNLSLFASKEILDIRFNSNKFTDTIKQGLANLFHAENNDRLIILSLPKLETATINAKWFKALEEKAVFIQFWPVARTQLPQWLAQRLRKVNLSLSKTGLDTLAFHTEGNLLAAQQIINRLHLQYGQGNIGDDELAQLLSDFSQIDLYSLADDLLVGDGRRIRHALINLQEKGTDPVLVLWLLTRELRAYLALLSAYHERADLNPIFSAFQIWPKRQGAYQIIFKRHQQAHLLALLQIAYQADASIKGLQTGEPWDHLLSLCLAMAAIPYLSGLPS